jgi:hypothetical protein
MVQVEQKIVKVEKKMAVINLAQYLLLYISDKK